LPQARENPPSGASLVSAATETAAAAHTPMAAAVPGASLVSAATETAVAAHTPMAAAVPVLSRNVSAPSRRQRREARAAPDA
jgi:hypothetical protein